MPKISQLSALTVPDSGDELPIVDVSTSTTKKITRTNLLKGAPLPADTVDTQAIDDGSVTPIKTSGGILVHRGFNRTDTLQTFTTSNVTYATVTATTIGGNILVEWGMRIANANSGAQRSSTVRILQDAATITPASKLYHNVLISGNSDAFWSFSDQYLLTSVSAGSHTWDLQALASAASSVQSNGVYIRVTEIIT